MRSCRRPSISYEKAQGRTPRSCRAADRRPRGPSTRSETACSGKNFSQREKAENDHLLLTIWFRRRRWSKSDARGARNIALIRQPRSRGRIAGTPIHLKRRGRPRPYRQCQSVDALSMLAGSIFARRTLASATRCCADLILLQSARFIPTPQSSSNILLERSRVSSARLRRCLALASSKVRKSILSVSVVRAPSSGSPCCSLWLRARARSLRRPD